MVTQVTSFKTVDGKLFDDEQAAVLHETKLDQDKYVNNLLYNIITSTDMVDQQRAKANVRRVFSSKNHRQIIRQMLDLFAEPGND